ncbi:MAG TPA: hypothetical protein VH575_29940, partial [Gemmataceae bacterium]
MLETLEPRDQPSVAMVSPSPIVVVASPPAMPSVAAVTSQMVSAMDQRMHLIAILQTDVSNVWKTIAQEAAAYVHQQWDH